MNNLLLQARTAARDPKECRRAIDAPRGIGFGDKAFRRLHHLHDSMAGFYRFSESVQRFRDDGNNHRVHQRLTYVLLTYPGGVPPKGKTFQALAEEAFKQILPCAESNRQ